MGKPMATRQKGMTMTTVAELDEKIEDKKRQIAQYEARKKAILAKEREQARKNKAAALTAIGEAFLRAVGEDWTRIDFPSLQAWLDGSAGDIRLLALTDERSSTEAKEQLDAFKSGLRNPVKREPAAGTPDGDADAVAPEGADAQQTAW